MASLGTHSFTFGYYFDSTTLKRLSEKDILYLSSIYANDTTNKASSKITFEQKTGVINIPENIDDINGIFNDQEILNNSRQYIIIPLNNQHVDNIAFNGDIFESSNEYTGFNFVEIGYPLHRIVYKNTNILEEDMPYIEFSYYEQSNLIIKNIFLKDCIYDINTNKITTQLESTINNVSSIKLLAAKPFRNKIFGSNVSPTPYLNIDELSTNDGTGINRTWGDSTKDLQGLVLVEPEKNNRNNIIFHDKLIQINGSEKNRSRQNILPFYDEEQNSTISVEYETTEFNIPNSNSVGIGCPYGYIEIPSKATTNSLLNTVNLTVNQQSYFGLVDTEVRTSFDLYKKLTNNNNPRDIKELYSNYKRTVFLYSKKYSDYKSSLADQYVNDLLQLAYNKNILQIPINSYYFNLDDFEFVDIFISYPVNLSSLDITVETNAPTPTPTPTSSVTASPTPSATATPTPSETKPVKKKGKVRIWGENKYKDINILKTPSEISQEENYVGVGLQFEKVFMGSSYALISREDKVIFPILDNRYSQLGIQTQETLFIDKLNTPISSINSRWNKISTGDDFTYLLDSSNHLYRWGDNKNNTLSSELNNIPNPAQLVIDTGKEVIREFKDVSCADENVFVITKDSNIYYTGIVLNNLRVQEFTSYKYNNKNWNTIFVAKDYILATKLDDAKLYLLKNKTLLSFDNEPSIIDDDISSYKKIIAGDNHFLVIKSDSSLWGFGDNTYNQLGIPKDSENYTTKLVKINSSVDWIDIAAGSSHSFGIDADGILYGWGDNIRNQLGLEDIDNFSNPTQIWKGNWISIDAHKNLSGGIVEGITEIFVTPTPSITPTKTPTPTPTTSNTPTSTPTPSQTTTNTPTPSQTITNTPSSSQTPTFTPTTTLIPPTPEATPTPTATLPYDFALIFKEII